MTYLLDPPLHHSLQLLKRDMISCTLPICTLPLLFFLTTTVLAYFFPFLPLFLSTTILVNYCTHPPSLPPSHPISVFDTNSLWVESAPDLGDFHPLTMTYGEYCRFYGNKCRHYTKPNHSGEYGEPISNLV